MNVDMQILSDNLDSILSYDVKGCVFRMHLFCIPAIEGAHDGALAVRTGADFVFWKTLVW